MARSGWRFVLLAALGYLLWRRRWSLWAKFQDEGGDRERAEGVLAQSALADFQKELPHPWQRIGNMALKPLVPVVPWRSRAKAPWLALRPPGGLEAHSDSKYQSWLQEVCRVLGLNRCPELLIEDQWGTGSNGPLRSYSEGQRTVLVLQGNMVKDWPMNEVKALLGYEVGRLVLKKLPQLVPEGFGEPMVNLLLAWSGYHAAQRVTRPNLGLAGAPDWIRDLLGSHGWRSYPSTGAAAEFAALGQIARRLVPGPLQPPIFAGLAANSEAVSQALKGKPLRLRLRAPKEHPVRDFADVAAALGLARLLQGSRSRAFVVTLDRAAALAAGDPKAAALAVLRSQRLLPPRRNLRREDLEGTLNSYVALSQEKAWAYRQEAALRNPAEPPAAVRVAELLRWAQKDTAKRLLALAEVRRHSRGEHHIGLQVQQDLWNPLAGYSALVLLLAMPLLTPIDAVRWASWCTMCLSLFALALPLLQCLGAPALPVPALSLGCLALYCLIAGSIWWNHLLGGARRWAILSGQLASQLVDQADAAAGIAFLTKDWAEMARRSLVALDQELCGSWRTSLHELASKLADLRQELEEPTPPSNGTKPLRDGYSSVPAEDDQPQQRLAAWAGRMEAAVERPTAKQPLWLKVDRAVQRAARVESARMRCALEATDPDQLQAMMTWWMARDPTAASSGGTATARLLQEDASKAEEGEGETLGALLFSERLHRRFPYTSFYGPDDYAVGGSVSEANHPGIEFERLQQALQHNLEALQDLRSKLAPYEESRTSLFWRWADVVAVATRFREALRFPAKAAAAAAQGTLGLRLEEVDLSDNVAEFTTISGLFLAALCGLAGCGLAVMLQRWGWAAGCFAFGCANSVLLQNYSRLHLPHVRRRLERRLKELSQQKDSLLRDVQQVQRVSRRTGMVQVRAHIFLQSVNVIRNMDYLTRCIKTEVQRLSGDKKARKAQLPKRLVANGLQLLLVLLPHSSPQWQQEALGGESCTELASMLFARRGANGAQLLSAGYEDARKRLWLLFRMVHLSSAIPGEVQGKLSALMDGYLRPVLVERRLPTGYQLHGSDSQAMLEDGQKRGIEDDEEEPRTGRKPG